MLREFGPVSGNTVMAGYTYAPGAGGLLSRQTVDLDARYYLRLAESGVLAFRARAFRSWGEFPDFTFFGGNSEMRGYDYLEFLGHKSIYANAELRFPLIEAMLTPIGVLGGIRGTFFFNFGVAGLAGQPLRIWSRDPVTVRPVVDYVGDPDTQSVRAVFGDPVTVSGFRLDNARASYGIGLTTYAIGFPIHFDWSWLTLFNPAWEDTGVRLRRHAARGGAGQRRVPAGPLPDVDRVRLLGASGSTGRGFAARACRIAASGERTLVPPHRRGPGSSGPRSR